MPHELQQRASTIWGQPVSVQRQLTNPFNNDVSTQATIAVMRKLAHQYSMHPQVVAVTAQAVGGGVRSQRDIASACFHWVRANIRFIEDEALMYQQLGIPAQQLDKELLIVPSVLLNMPQPMGDCDDFCLLLASMLLCAGLQPYFVTVAADAQEARKFSHVYICCALRDEGTHICLDAGNRFSHVSPGWETNKVTRKAVWAI